jgi:hypothetical protein
MVEKTSAFRQRRAADTARWRERLQRGAAVYPVEVDGTTFDLMERYGGLKDSKTGDRQAVATALGKLLRRALEALLREDDKQRTKERCGRSLALDDRARGAAREISVSEDRCSISCERHAWTDGRC